MFVCYLSTFRRYYSRIEVQDIQCTGASALLAEKDITPIRMVVATPPRKNLDYQLESAVDKLRHRRNELENAVVLHVNIYDDGLEVFISGSSEGVHGVLCEITELLPDQVKINLGHPPVVPLS